MKLKFIFSAITASLTAVSAAVPSFATDWVYLGQASTGEAVYVDRDSIVPGHEGSEDLVAFTYSLNEEEFNAIGDCPANQWYVEGYGIYSPQSQATQDMLDYVCQ